MLISDNQVDNKELFLENILHMKKIGKSDWGKANDV